MRDVQTARIRTERGTLSLSRRNPSRPWDWMLRDVNGQIIEGLTCEQAAQFLGVHHADH